MNDELILVIGDEIIGWFGKTKANEEYAKALNEYKKLKRWSKRPMLLKKVKAPKY